MSTPLELFRTAEAYVLQHYYSDIENARELLKVKLEDLNKHYFMLQYTHVVYCSGFKWKVVDEKWLDILKVYYYFDLDLIVENMDEIRVKAMEIIGHRSKIEAILDTAKWLRLLPEERFRRFLLDGGKNLNLFKRLGYIGDITKYHLAFCLGVDVSKPDVHITRFADHFNKDPLTICKELSEETGHPIRIVDAILWRAAEQGILDYQEG